MKRYCGSQFTLYKKGTADFYASFMCNYSVFVFRYPDADIYVYTGDIEATPGEILSKVTKTLNVKLEREVKFIYLNKRRWVEADMYPYFTLLGQSLGSIYLGFEALNQLNPDIFIETTGFSFTLPLFKYIGGCKTGCYVHYPTITAEMLKRVSNRTELYNNRSQIARNPFFTMGKLMYYRIFAWVSLFTVYSYIQCTFLMVLHFNICFKYAGFKLKPCFLRNYTNRAYVSSAHFGSRCCFRLSKAVLGAFIAS